MRVHKIPNTVRDLAQMIDHTCLKPDASEAEIRKTCAEAKKFGFKTVCVEAQWLALVVGELSDSEVLPITVISFPHGTDTAYDKAEQTIKAIHAGAKEVDMVLNRKFLLERDYHSLHEDIASVVDAAVGFPVKVILETSELTHNEIASASALCKLAGASFVKTSTGFSSGGAKAEDVAIMRDVVGRDVGVKASGGVRTLEDAFKMIEAGASRIGMSASVVVVEEFAARL